METLRVTLWNGQGRVVYNGGIFSLPVVEHEILERAMNYYFTREVCPIRRAAIAKSLQQELANAMQKTCGSGARAEWAALPESVRSCICAGEDIRWYKLC